MSIENSTNFYLGPKEIYLKNDLSKKTREESSEVHAFLGEDSPASLQKCIAYFKKKKVVECEFQNGDLPENNILMLAAEEVNASVLTWMVQHCDPKILSMHD